ncbi:hypothetical protein ACI65C_003896 [Semiaphis heraclei]
MSNSDVGNTKKRHRLSGSEYKKRRAATEAEIAKQCGLMFKFFKSKHDDSVKSEVIDEDTEVTDFNLENDNPDEHLNLDIDIIKDNDDTVKSGVIDENTEVTDFNLENDNPDDHLNLEVDIIKDNDDTVKSEVTDEDGRSDIIKKNLRFLILFSEAVGSGLIVIIFGDSSSGSDSIKSLRWHNLFFDLSCTSDIPWELVIDCTTRGLKTLGETVKATWAKLRSCHRDALRRQKKCFKSGAAAEIIKQWKFQKQMEYLLPYMANRKRSSNVLDSEDEDDFTQGEITATEQISENNYDLEASTLENDNEILVHKNNEHDINVDETEDSVEDDISNLLQQSIASREQRAKERALERKKLEDSKTLNDPLYHFFMSMYHTTQKLSPASQYFIKNEIYKAVSKAEANFLNIPTTFQQTNHEQPRSTATWSYEQNSLSSHETSSSDTYYVNTQTCENSNDMVNYINNFSE